MVRPEGLGPVAPRPLIVQEFRRPDLRGIRHRVAACAAEAGLVGTRLHGFVLSVNEITTNAVVHGGGLGRLRLWLATRQLICEISDTGPGLPDGLVGHLRLPPAESQGGRGLWLTRSLCDGFTVQSGRLGTTVRLAAGLPAPG